MDIICAAIEERFQLTGRGTVVAIGRVTGLPVGRPLRATVVRPDGSRLQAQAFKEWFLRRDPRPLESEAFLLMNVLKDEIPDGSIIEIDTV